MRSFLFKRLNIAFKPLPGSPSPSLLRNATSPRVRGFGSPCNVCGFAKGSPFGGAVEQSETERARKLSFPSKLLISGLAVYALDLFQIIVVGMFSGGHPVGWFGDGVPLSDRSFICDGC